MKNKRHKVLTLVLALVLLGSLAALWQRQIQLDRAARAQAEAQALLQQSQTTPTPAPAPVPTPSSTPLPAPDLTPEPTPWVWQDAPVENDAFFDSLQSLDLAALQTDNPDVLGWIEIPDTTLAYPLVQGEDNSYYLTHTWQKQYNSAGAIFLEQYCSPALDDFNTIIYGHNMKNGSMFGTLRNYRSQDYCDAHPHVYLVDENGVHRYEIFAAYEAAVTSSTYRLALAEREETESFLADCMARSVIETGVTPTIHDRVLTLSTCTGTGSYDTRWVVQAKLSPLEPKP